MPKNYFLNREPRSMDSSKVKNGDFVFIVTKEKQGEKHFSNLHLVKIKQTLSNGDSYKNGFKVNGQEVDKGSFGWESYYKNCIMNFNTPEKVNMEEVQKAYEYLKDAPLTDKFYIGRIQYIALPSNFTPQPDISTLKLGLANNQICDYVTLQEQLEYIKSNYYIECNNYNILIEKLIRFRTLVNMLDQKTLKSMRVLPNYCEITIENNKYIKKIRYFEINH